MRITLLLVFSAISIDESLSSFILSGSKDTDARLWDGEDYLLNVILTNHTEEVTGVGISADGTLVGTSSIDVTVKIWDAATGELKVSVLPSDQGSFDGSSRAVAFSPDASRFLTGNRDYFGKVWETKSGELLTTLADHQESIYGVGWSPVSDDEVVTGARDTFIKVWNPSTGELKTTLEGHEQFIWGVAYSSDGKWLASTSTDDKLIRWNMQTATLDYAIEAGLGGCWSVAYSPDGKLIATGGQGVFAPEPSAAIRIWDAESGALVSEILDAQPGMIYGVAFSPDSSRLASGGMGSGDVSVWDVATGERLATMEGHTEYVRSLAWSSA